MPTFEIVEIVMESEFKDSSLILFFLTTRDSQKPEFLNPKLKLIQKFWQIGKIEKRNACKDWPLYSIKGMLCLKSRKKGIALVSFKKSTHT